VKDYFNARELLNVGDKDYVIYRLDALEKAGLQRAEQAPLIPLVMVIVGAGLAAGLL